MTAPPAAPAQQDRTAPPASPSPRRLATPSWLDLRLVVGVVLVLAAVLLGAVITSRASDTRPVVTVDHSLAAGTTLRAQDLRIEQVQVPGSGYLDTLSDAVGKTLTRPMSSGELLPRSAVGSTPARTTLTVPLAAGAAPQLRTGQRIELWLSTPSCPFVVLLPEVTVQSVRTDDDGFGGGADNGQSVVISVDPSQVRRVVAAQSIPDAKLRAGVLTGDADRSAATVLPGGADGSGLPSDLAGCAASNGSDGTGSDGTGSDAGAATGGR